MAFSAVSILCGGYFFFYAEKNKEILFISSAAMSGPAKNLGVEYTSGINSYFKYANEQKMLGGDKISFEIYDDQYEPFLTKTNITKAIKKPNIYGVLGVVGTPTAEEAMKIAINNDIPFLMPFSGAEFLYSNNELTFTLRPSYKKEAERMVKYMTASSIKRVAIVYQNDSFGLAALSAFSKSIANSNIELVAEGVYNRNTLSINYAFNEIKKQRPDAVVIAGTHKPSIAVIKKAADENMNCLFFNFSFAGYEPLYEEAKKKAVNLNNIFITQAVAPLFIHSDTADEFKKIYQKYYPEQKPNSIAFEGFLAGKTIVKALSLSKKRSLQGFIDSLTTLNMQLSNENLAYTANDHAGLKRTYLLRFDKNGSTLIDE